VGRAEAHRPHPALPACHGRWRCHRRAVWGALAAGDATPDTPEEFFKAVADLGRTVELNGANLDVILHS